MHGLNQYDYAARYYDPAFARFTTMDPHSENYYSWSPYAYVGNNPIRLVDPNGKDWRDVVVGVGVGILTNIIPGSSNIRDSHSPNSSSHYNRALKAVDDASLIAGALMITGGAGSIGSGSAAVEAGGVAGATVIGAPEGAVISIGGVISIGAGELSIASGVYLMANTANNKSQGYDRGKKNGGQNSSNKDVYVPKDPITGEPIKVEKSKAGNTKIDKEAKGKPHTQLRLDASGNYPQRVTFDSKGRKRVDTHFTTHNEPGKTNAHRHIYYKDGRRQKQEYIPNE